MNSFMAGDVPVYGDEMSPDTRARHGLAAGPAPSSLIQFEMEWKKLWATIRFNIPPHEGRVLAEVLGGDFNPDSLRQCVVVVVVGKTEY